MEEQELMRQVQNGDEMAFSEIVLRYKDKIVNFLWQMTGDYQKSVELSQETFMRVYFKANRYRPIAPLSSWIYTIASNLAKTEMKKMRRYLHVPLDDVQNKMPKEVPFSEDPANAEMIRNLRAAVDTLHPRYKIPLILKDIEGFSQEEIAQIMNKPLGTIKARISRARRYLKIEMESNKAGAQLCKE
jgi:RNA polymerase sigma-70 factor (ECF subfamily)